MYMPFVTDVPLASPGNTIMPTWSCDGHNSLSKVWTPPSAQSILELLGRTWPVRSVLVIDPVLSMTSMMFIGGSAPAFTLASEVAVSVTGLLPRKLPKDSGTVACCCTSMAFAPIPPLAFGPPNAGVH